MCQEHGLLYCRVETGMSQEATQAAAAAEVLAAVLRLSKAVSDPGDTAFTLQFGAWHSWLSNKLCHMVSHILSLRMLVLSNACVVIC